LNTFGLHEKIRMTREGALRVPHEFTPSGGFQALEVPMTLTPRIFFGSIQLAFGCCPLVLGVLSTPTEARTWHVREDGSGDAPTVQAGIDSAAVSDTILVGPGTYYENIDFLGKDIVLKAEYGPLLTTLDGSLGNDSVVKFHNAETRAAVLEGFTITGGQGTLDFGSPRGGGIVCVNASPVVRGNHIVRNESTISYGVGGGMAVGNGMIEEPLAGPLIEGNLFKDNVSSSNGGGLVLLHAEVIVRGNVFRDNRCVYDGGAIDGRFGVGYAIIEDNQFWENVAGDHGGGVVLGHGGSASTSFVTVQRNLFVRNRAEGVEGGANGTGGGMWILVLPGTIRNNTIIGNTGLGGSLCTGGGLLLGGTPASLEVYGNLIAFNSGCGITCRDNVQTVLGPNLLWQNTVSDLGSVCPPEWAEIQIIADPLFCGPGVDDYRVASDSPALTGEEVMGAFDKPGCGPVAVHKITWGRIKTLYR
jgi:hypothetical protein